MPKPTIAEADARKVLAENLKRIMVKKKTDAPELARIVNRKPMAIHRILKAEHSPKFHVLIEIAAALECTVDDLLKPAKKTG